MKLIYNKIGGNNTSSSKLLDPSFCLYYFKYCIPLNK